ncbi:hypothetical protein AL035_22045 [Salipiger aestuarii]|nr:hypothetical protein AL035_22045 [Salipiger aestuarii]
MDVSLAPDTPPGTAVLAGVPRAFPLGLATGAIDEKVERAGSAAIWQADIQCFLAAAQRAEIGHSPIEANQLQQAFHDPSRLPQRQPEQHFQSEASLDRSVTEAPRPARLPLGGGTQIISGSNQIANGPRCLSAAL